MASYYFYMCWNAKYAVLIFFSTMVTWVSGLLLDRCRDGGSDSGNGGCNSSESEGRKKLTVRRELIVAGSFILNLSVLFWFKYANFAFDTMEKLFSAVHITLQLPAVDVLLPVGISFYTFQALSYTMDVYRGEIYAEKDFFRYALFVSFFPQLVAGPIERSKNLLRQLAKTTEFNYERAREGMLLMLWGYFLKLVLADRIAIFVDTAYNNYAVYTGWYLVAATMLFAMQIYCDFSGYSVIAIGAAKILGIDLMENFDAPYLSNSVAGFWRHWHISLTSWFKDYLYIPLGGSRCGKVRKYINKMIVFLASGLWHGASISFVVWGGLNGLYQIIEELGAELLKSAKPKATVNAAASKYSGTRTPGDPGWIGAAAKWLLGCIITFILVDFSWIFFRANGCREALLIIRHMADLRLQGLSMLTDGSLYLCGLDRANFLLMLAALLVLLAADICKKRGIVLRRVVLRQVLPVRCILFTAAVCAVLTFGVWGPAFSEANFIYFQF
ncbi:MAG: MBOAT family O-acyltransferase [Eubacteriales bacterium]|nr:MBOAT family O-acyltransferase [Eubacteriales bacterium]